MHHYTWSHPGNGYLHPDDGEYFEGAFRAVSKLQDLIAGEFGELVI